MVLLNLRDKIFSAVVDAACIGGLWVWAVIGVDAVYNFGPWFVVKNFVIFDVEGSMITKEFFDPEMIPGAFWDDGAVFVEDGQCFEDV